MGKSILTIAKEIKRRAYTETPLGQAETELRRFYERVARGQTKLSETDKKRVNVMRTLSEKDIEKANLEEGEKLRKLRESWETAKADASQRIDSMLLDSMLAELEFLKTIDSNVVIPKSGLWNSIKNYGG